MKLGIRTKLIGNLVIAAVLPLAVAIITLQTAGYRHQVRQKGATYRSEAQHVARNLSLIAENQINALRELLELTDLAALVAQQNARSEPLTGDALMARINELEARWPGLPADGAEIRPLLTNTLAARLRQFQNTQPLFAEMLVTDERGQLIAATGKTSDFYQADEAWWQHAAQLKAGEAWIEGLAFDESAQVLSLDVCLPVKSVRAGSAPPVGVIKAVLNVSPLFASIPFLLSDQDAVREVIRSDGQVLLRLLDEQFVPRSATISAGALQDLKPDQAGWVVTQLDGRSRQMVGYAPLKLFGVFTESTAASGAQPLMVLVFSDAAAVLAPVRSQLTLITLVGSLLVLGLVWVGIHFSNRHFIEPLETLRAAARAVAATAKTDGAEPRTTAATERSADSASAMVQRVKEIQTGDELEALGRDFAAMAGRLLNYQEQLEADVAAKTAEIQRDLAMARDFQQALLPREYPPIPSLAARDELSLQFHHVYHPASAVGGDFFDVIKLGDHRAGVLIADVMGHGTRSALVTAILRTLLQDVANRAEDPGQFLELLNRHFHAVIQQTGQLVFVSAFYMVIDTELRTVACASAGHPSPLVANRLTGVVVPLFGRLRDNPALGLFPQSHHTVFTRELRPHEVFLLFTDGIVEATNAADEEFGRERLTEVMREHLEQDLPSLLQAILTALARFSEGQVLSDDVCLVGVEAIADRSHAGDDLVLNSGRQLHAQEDAR